MLRKHLVQARFQLRKQSRGWILGRIACLGHDVLGRMCLESTLWNIQKGRVDYLVRLQRDATIRPNTATVARHMFREDIIPLIQQQETATSYTSTPPKLILMDSFSELTDQLFIHAKNRWEFCCNYGDISDTDEFRDKFEKHGLLPIEEIDAWYRELFFNLRTRYGEIPIVFMHFPTKLDPRQIFHDRAKAIHESIQQLSLELTSLYSISVDNAIVDWPEKHGTQEFPDNFPYHYNNRTYEEFRLKVEASLAGT